MDSSLVIVGASGLIGQAVLKAAISHQKIKRIYTLTRSPLGYSDPKLTSFVSEEMTLSQEALSDTPPPVGIIALGTTIKKAGSKEALRAVDVDLVVTTAQHLHAAGVRHLLVVSCLGANSASRSHYLCCKGDMEDAVAGLGFESLTFLQPGPLSGPRIEPRIDEKILQAVLAIIKPVVKGKLINYMPIESMDMATAMLSLALQPKHHAVQRVTSSQMMALITH